MSSDLIIPFSQLTNQDVAKVGGKNASLGEMIHHLAELNIAIPDGFAITVSAFHEFLAFNTLSPLIQKTLDRLNHQTLDNLSEVAACCRDLIAKAPFPKTVDTAIKQAYQNLAKIHANMTVAVRSSATAEDSPTASFAGQHDSFLNVTGEDNVVNAVKWCYASLFNDRAIKYRIDNGFSDMQVGQFSESLSLQIMPTMIHYNLVQGATDPNDVYALGAGGRIKLNKRISLNAEYYYQLEGYKLPGTYNSLAVGFDIETGGHVFQLNFTNSTGMTERSFISETTGNFFRRDIHFGFTISRVFTIVKPKQISNL